ncbi:MAG: alpha/beta hydrolase [Acidimicrobiales bacterium]|nr:alpha/beta hydrolase [Acidimicrobiales bacterium]MCB9374188.1 alpha/beta hydrolase [Microthrixaceae bacterium]
MSGALAYDPARRPRQPPTPAPDAFAVHRAALATGAEIAYVHEGAGGTPLVLLHGCPETKRIWWRNIGPLADAGFEVIAPDFRGVGDSGPAPGDVHGVATYAKDVHALVAGHLGHDACVVAAGDLGGVVATDLVHRYPGFVTGNCAFNTVPPMGADYAAAGLDFADFSALGTGPTGDYREWQGARPDELAAILHTPEARRLWVAGVFRSRLWASPGSFTDAEVDFQTEPFADEDRLRASWAPYQLAYGRPLDEMPLTDAVEVPTLVLYGADDHVIGPDFLVFAEVAYPNRIGPLAVAGAGHFLPWERADVFNEIVPAVLRP